VTERETVSNLERLVSVLERYRALGFTLAIDDVGDGNCTFEMLAAIMPDFIKISGRFCNAATHAGPRSAIVGVLAFARASGASVVAEGIEDGATANLLRALGVQLGQGYLLGRPSYPAELGGDEPATGVLRR
jgi:EAL domain-containing protein (putative c-di-GMP-specific phosphodiesterase class I)